MPPLLPIYNNSSYDQMAPPTYNTTLSLLLKLRTAENRPTRRVPYPPGIPPYHPLLFTSTVCFLRSALHPKSAALKDPEVRKEVERRLKDLERQGLFIKETSKNLETILIERRKA